MILNLCSHAVTVSSKFLVVVCGDKREKERKSFRWLMELRRALAAIVASLSVRRAAASISMHLSLTESPVVRWGGSGPPGDMGLVGVVGLLGVSGLAFLEQKKQGAFILFTTLQYL